MKNVLLVVVALLLWCCSGITDRNTSISADVKVNQRPEGVVQNTTFKPDTTPPAPRRPNYVRDTARPVNEINTEFPYDIALKTAGGELLNSAEILKPGGKPTILLFWLTTCAPCALEMTAIQQQYDQWQQQADFRLVAISTDFAKNYPNFVKRVNEKQWPWETYNDVNREFRKVMPGGLNGLPQTFVLDKDGNIVLHKRKYRPGDEKALFEKVKMLATK